MGKEDAWMERMAKHQAMTSFVDFMADEENPDNCVAIKIRETGAIIYGDDPSVKDFLGNSFKTLNDACFYDFAKDMEGCADEK